MGIRLTGIHLRRVLSVIKNRIKLAVKAISFTLLTLMIVGMVNQWMIPKNYYNDDWPSTNTFKDFYKLEKNSVDVLFLGSSFAISAFNPQVIYEEYGITGYNLASEQQSVLISYYWLKEALKYQSPKVVVLETLTFHRYTSNSVYNKLNCSESAIRYAMDPMRISPLKLEAAKEIEKLDPTQNALSFFFQNIRFHSRWTSLSEEDFTEKSMIEHGGVKGYTVLGDYKPDAEDVTFTADKFSGAEPEPMEEVAEVYLDKIVKLCEENDIDLIFAKVPSTEYAGRYISTKNYADKNNIPFYDFNEKGLFEEIGYKTAEDGKDHLNYKGAEKVSLYMGKLFRDEYGLAAHEDPSFIESGRNYRHKVKNILLTQTNDVNEYLEMLNDDTYSIFLFAPLKYSEYIDDEIMNRLQALGFKEDLQNIEGTKHYCAVKDADAVTERLTDSDLMMSGTIRSGRTIYRFTIDTKIMKKKLHIYSLTIDGITCAEKSDGLSIVVYDNDQMKVIDRVNIKTTMER